MSDPADQRRCALAARRRLTPAVRRRFSHRACTRLSRLAVFRRARRIGLYWPLSSEIDPRPLLAACRAEQRVYLPRVQAHHLRFVAITGPDFPSRNSSLGVREPRGGRSVAVHTLDLLIMPLAAFDARAHRIGLGGGFYDRTLSGYRQRPYACPQLVGLAYDVQRVDAIRPKPWDVSLDMVVSERAVYPGYRRVDGPGLY
ncbi:5-formyltetrahydrofolate cyclo-ligase [Salinisphaera sp. T31B1]|uniref:5-formyltetrahydrofolate cyclo-ligase n=1 Tax=Salinisphaera sp. T31B1 TaxID=727963 RepID=UPI0033414591